MYIYHVSIDKRLHKIQNNKFCALEYHPIKEQEMHKKLHKLYDSLRAKKSSDSIFRFCFYDTYAIAIKALNTDFMNWDCHILRFKKNDFTNKGFNWQWDEGFNVGDAHLYWVKESPNNHGYSELGIDFSQIDIMVSNQWISLASYFTSITVIPPVKISNNPNIKKNYFAKMANKLLKRTKNSWFSLLRRLF
ncbi:hypothetical protein [Shewanella frigidimarina]|uniref:hypothetical protein n=1 Tax=Shewanella frigidimarina TaxID=56812 RepID=UPI000F4EB8EB|nr:hypothetical protein [Shewanella frigidimarina]RPA35259.1 hypothetical protein EGC78_05300 [Shewanella frigidimarina]